ncbi:MAG: hypothetical protein ACJA2W_000798 [Planctomycetota bacterium]|jgi:hypothetical protein
MTGSGRGRHHCHVGPVARERAGNSSPPIARVTIRSGDEIFVASGDEFCALWLRVVDGVSAVGTLPPPITTAISEPSFSPLEAFGKTKTGLSAESVSATNATPICAGAAATQSTARSVRCART